MSVPQPIRCQRCGAFFPPGKEERFCMHCGTPLQTDASAIQIDLPPVPPQYRQPPVRVQRRSNIWVWAGVGVAIAFLLVGLLSLISGNLGGTSHPSHSAPQTLPPGAKSGM